MKNIYLIVICFVLLSCVKNVEPPQRNYPTDSPSTFQIHIEGSDYSSDTSKAYVNTSNSFSLTFSFNGYKPTNFKGVSVAGLRKGEVVTSSLSGGSSSSSSDSYYTYLSIPNNATEKDSIKIKFSAKDLLGDTASTYFTVFFQKIQSTISLDISSSNKLNDSTYYLTSGSNVQIQYSTRTSIGIKKIELFEEIDGIRNVIIGFPINNVSTLNFSSYFYYTMNSLGKNVQIIGIMTDKNGVVDSSSISFLTVAPAIKANPNNFLGAQQNTAYGSYYSSYYDNIYKSIQNLSSLSTIDITYAYIHQQPYLLSTAARTDTSTHLNEVYSVTSSICLFAETNLTSAQYDTVSSNYVNTINLPITGAQKVKIEEGKVYSFINDKGNKGLVRIASIVSGQDGYIIMDIKAQGVYSSSNYITE